MENVDYLQKKKNLLKRYYKLTQEIEMKIEKEDWDGINRVFVKTKKLIDAIDELDKIFGKNNDAEILTLLTKIKELDYKNQTLLNENFDIIKKKISNVKGSKKTNKAYGNQKKGMNLFLNKLV